MRDPPLHLPRRVFSGFKTLGAPLTCQAGVRMGEGGTAKKRLLILWSQVDEIAALMDSDVSLVSRKAC